MILLITVTKPVKQVVVIHETTSGAALKVPVPTPKVAGFKVVLIGLKLKVPARGSGSKALITAGQCVAKQFVFNARFVLLRTEARPTSRAPHRVAERQRADRAMNSNRVPAPASTSNRGPPGAGS